MSEKYAVIGKSVPKIDGRVKVTGQAKYTGDLKFPNMLVGKILTSPHAHARILSIDTSQAEKLPGVKAVITHRDVPALKYGISPARWDENIFCIDRVRFVGDKVAAVAAIDEETVYKALKLIKVEYEVLPAVFDPVAAMQEGAPQIHDEYPRNINTEIHQNFGDVEKAFAAAHHVRTDQFTGQRTYQSPIEPHSAISIWEDGKLTVYTSTQSPHYFQYYIAREFGLKMGDVRVVKPFVGGGFGGKLEPTGLEFAGAVLSRLTGRPVKMFYDRHEMFAHNRGRHRQIMKITTGVDKDGKILGVHADFIMDGGAYTSLGIATAYYAGAMLPLTYEFENYKFDMYRVYTNLPACGAQRGHGAPQPRYAFECHLDMLAEDLGMDPLELRLRNARRPDTVTPNEFKINSCELKACIEKVREISGWDKKKGKLPHGRGIGIAVGSFVSGAGYPIYRTNLPHSAAMIKVHEDGSAATLYTGAVDIGQGTDTVLCQMAAEAMGYTYEHMKIVAADTETTPHDFGAYSSRQTLMSGAAVKQAGEEVKRQILETAAAMLDIDVSTLDCREGVVFCQSNPEIQKTFAEVAREFFVRKGPLVGRGSYAPPKLGGKFKGAAVGTSPAYSFAAQVSEVAIDEETGEIDVKAVWDVHDCGTVINPALLHAQVHGALFMGMGEAVWEEVVFDEQGRIKNANLSEYRLPTALDMPEITSQLVESCEPDAPWGVKEVGEGATIPTMGCYSNAIYDAMGVRVYSLPLSYEKVWRALKEKREKEAGGG
ncbi:4-hydroxybenzoyl-CoA reductase subunit alpha [Desulfotomaculum copahuensis]|uniref:4-hydroxybenzoyl-CoA reductase subunit alpha n=1 Tax=Desulfotomaculum copahuensis TaxID=1838280 RepID=A0A1B7LGM6_9FIRM|nr:4-hydroxybenzoyl-CoA reductase subunit alpha [Desulfotomaculum copahuensis]OAT85256.1 4-hydroxybenzoyl-CoA reductase subunit alpha [Desulfotomaculum copahuensis]